MLKKKKLAAKSQTRMSCPDNLFALAAKAQNDFESILLYTKRQWGIKQRDEYATLLVSAFYKISKHSQTGRTRRDLPDDCRYVIVGSHLIIYRAEDKLVYILRILHQRMNVPEHLH